MQFDFSPRGKLCCEISEKSMVSDTIRSDMTISCRTYMNGEFYKFNEKPYSNNTIFLNI